MTKTNIYILNTWRQILFFIPIFLCFASSVYAVDVILEWGANSEPDLAGYRAFYREEGQPYNYTNPAWEGADTTCTIYNLIETKSYYFVIRAFDNEGFESSDSNEVGLEARTNPINTIPDQPVLLWPTDGETNIPLTPELQNNAFSDQNIEDTHFKTQWQISRDNSFTPLSLVLDVTSKKHLTTLPVPDLLLSTGTIYYWRVRFYDNHNGESEWSDPYLFQTIINPVVDTNSNPVNNIPDQPVLLWPTDGETNIPLTPELQNNAFSDQNIEDTHFKTQWQISTDNSFTPLSLVLDVTSKKHLTTLPVPDLVLSTGTIYYWRVRFYADNKSESEWSDAYWFQTVINPVDDTNSNGIPDDQEVDTTVDIDENGIFDIFQDDIKCVNAVTEDEQIGVKISTNIMSIESIKSTDPNEIADFENRPDEMPLGVISFKITVENPGDTAVVTVYFSEAASDGAGWYKYDSINGWQDYSDHAIFSDSRKSVTLELKDGGFGDADGIANGVIIDPSGFGGISSTSKDSESSSGVSSAGGGGCFIATAAYGSLMAPHVKILCEIRDRFLITNRLGKCFVDFYYKYSPSAAKFIAEHGALRAMVRVTLAPVVGISWIALKMGPGPTVLLALFFGIGLIALFRKGPKKRFRKIHC
jgi:chitinase